VLIAASVVLRRHENQPGTCGGMALLRGSAEGMQDADDCDISRDDADSDGYDYGQAENDGHQERDHGQPPLALIFKIRFKVSFKTALY
jgi:hypothetical protein